MASENSLFIYDQHDRYVIVAVNHILNKHHIIFILNESLETDKKLGLFQKLSLFEKAGNIQDITIIATVIPRSIKTTIQNGTHDHDKTIH